MSKQITREQIAAQFHGLTIKDAQWVESEQYWVLIFDNGSEVCMRLMADLVQTPSHPATAPPDEVKTGLPFDQAILIEMRKAAAEQIAAHSELRSVAVVLDYRGQLNDHGSVSKGLWIGENGKVESLDAIFGSIQNAFVVLDIMMQRAAEFERGLRERAVALAAEITNRRKELAATTATSAENWPDDVYYDRKTGEISTSDGRPLAGAVTKEALNSWGYHQVAIPAIADRYEPWHRPASAKAADVPGNASPAAGQT